jgi:hypothetical protein
MTLFCGDIEQVQHSPPTASEQDAAARKGVSTQAHGQQVECTVHSTQRERERGIDREGERERERER